MGIFPSDGCGIGADPDCAVPTNAVISVRFDRFLNPTTVNRQAIRVSTGNLDLPFVFEVVYDPVERVAEFRPAGGARYQPRTLYRMELVVAPGPSDDGIRAFDGAPLSDAGEPLQSSFFTADGPTEPKAVPPAPPCSQVVEQVFGALGNCAGHECHRKGENFVLGSEAPLGDAPHQLWLDQPSSFALSAIERVARQTEVGGESGGVPSERGARFGDRMALVQPRSPGSSYLMYKLLVEPDNFRACPRGAGAELCETPGDPCLSNHPWLPLPDGECLTPPPAELERLREWFVRGEPMPRANSLGIRGSVWLQGLRALAAFIAAGAECGQ